MKKYFLVILITALSNAQNTYWQQKVDYKMNVVFDVDNYQYTGSQTLVYTNNSNDTLRKIYYHLYPNAFQPNSEMDARLQNIADPDGRMVTKVKVEDKDVKISRIKELKPNEIGFLHIANFKHDNNLLTVNEYGTIAEIILQNPILPKSKTTFTLDFSGQVPNQIRRSGRNNKEGVALSMSQWYPKIAEFDFEGWHADPYIAREFQGVWGNFDVKITIDENFILGGSGILQNPNEIGFGYEKKGTKVTKNPKTETLTWHFVANNVHDFTWAGDRDYIHDVVETKFGTTLHFLYKDNPKIIDNWKKVQPETEKLMDFYNQTVGKYPYPQYSVIQGGDGGMEYAMCTLILGEGDFEGLKGVIAHEMAHSWFQHVLASNESKNAWMDEGFTSYLEDLGLYELSDKKTPISFKGFYDAYTNLANSGKEQPITTHSDRYDENRSYTIGSYVKGELFLTQLEYLIGKDNVLKTLKRYFNDFKFKHPTPNDIKRSAERVSGAELDWYLTDWTKTTNKIDYSIDNVVDTNNKTEITLQRLGRMPMPIDILVEYTDGSQEQFYIPLRMMFYQKPNPNSELKRTVLKDWAWAYPKYSFEIDKPKSSIKKITIDPSGLMADVKKENNVFEQK